MILAALALASAFEYKMISSGRNFPSLRLDSDHFGDICILLHQGVAPSEIRTRLGLTDDEWKQRIAALEKEQLVWLDSPSQTYRPAITVITRNDAERYFAVSRAVVRRTADEIAQRLPEIRRRYASVAAFRHTPFRDASFLILSDVLLDNWQIRNVDDALFHRPRTPHAGKNYYFAILERTDSSREAFGIYGNSGTGLGAVTIGLYGNRRESLNLVTASDSDLSRLFGPHEASAKEFRNQLTNELLDAARGGGVVAKHARGFDALGLTRKGTVLIPVFIEQDDEKLSEIAGLLTPALIRILQDESDSLRAVWAHSPYANEVSFQEFFMWWYHFFYTAVTDRLAAENHLVIPRTGTATYLVTE